MIVHEGIVAERERVSLYICTITITRGRGRGRERGRGQTKESRVKMKGMKEKRRVEGELVETAYRACQTVRAGRMGQGDGRRDRGKDGGRLETAHLACYAVRTEFPKPKWRRDLSQKCDHIQMLYTSPKREKQTMCL